MNVPTILDELEQAARQLDYEVRYEKGNFRGGPCSVGGESIIVLNKRHLPETQLVVLANALRETPIDTIFLKPAVRDALEEVWAETDAAEQQPSDPRASDDQPPDPSRAESAPVEPEVTHADG